MKKEKTKLKKLEDIYSFLDDKPKPTKKQLEQSTKNLESEGLFKPFEEEKLIIDKDDTEIIKTFNEDKPIPIKNITRINTAIDDDIKEEMNIISDRNPSDLMKAFESLSNPNNMESNTILSNKQVIACSTINYLAQVYDIEFFKQFIKVFPRYRISGDDGRGRKELIQIAEAIQRDKENEHNRLMEVLGRR
jgi:hypothetical protein